MKNSTKRWLCWAPAIAVLAMFGFWCVTHWMGKVAAPASGVMTLVGIAVILLAHGGYALGLEKPPVVYLWQPREDRDDIRDRHRSRNSPNLHDEIREFLANHDDD